MEWQSQKPTATKIKNNGEGDKKSEDNKKLAIAIVLQRLPGMGPGRYWQLQQRLGSDDAILMAPVEQLCQILGDAARTPLKQYQNNPTDNPLIERAQCDLAWLSEHHAHIITAEHADYPRLLQQIQSPPPLLSVQGSSAALSLPQLALVGARNATPRGGDNARQFARQLSEMGFAITSGLALGVDAAAHGGALAANGVTIAVVANGLDQTYPRQHHTLAQQIVDHGGAVVSEFPLATTPRRENFPRRNRIISGLSIGTLVVEAAIKSGSLITARYALEQNREVFAIPGSIHNPLSRGCHALIKQGATLVESIDDLAEPLAGYLSLKRQELQGKSLGDSVNQDVVAKANLNRDQRQVLDCLDDSETSVDNLIQQTGMGVEKIIPVLMQLELDGWVQQTVAGGYLLCP